MLKRPQTNEPSPPKIAFLQLVVIYHTCLQLLKKRPVFLRILGRRKIHTMLVAKFLLTKTQERAKGGIYEQRLPL